MDNTKVASILMLVAGILNLVGALIILVVLSLFSFIGIRSELGFMFIFFVIFFILSVICGILKIVSSQMMKNPKKAKSAGILGLVAGILTLDVIAIVGGILVLAMEK